MKIRELIYSAGTAVGVTWPPGVWLRTGGGRLIPHVSRTVLKGVDSRPDAAPEENDLYVVVEDDSGEFTGPVVVDAAPEYKAYLADELRKQIGKSLSEVGELEIEAP